MKSSRVKIPIKATELRFDVVMFIVVLFKMVLNLTMKLCIQIKAIEQFFRVILFTALYMKA